MESECTLIPYRGFESLSLRQKTKRPPRGAFSFSRRVQYGLSNPVRPTQPHSGMLARSSRSERVESLSLRQQVRHSMSLQPETVECLLFSAAFRVVPAYIPYRLRRGAHWEVRKLSEYLTFGEITLRLKILGHERFFQSPYQHIQHQALSRVSVYTRRHWAVVGVLTEGPNARH